MTNYNTFHKKNKYIQKKPIHEKNYTYQTILSLIKKYLVNPGNVLDIGCGVGTIDFYLANRMSKILGIDISSDAIFLADKSRKQMNIPNVEFSCVEIADIEDRAKFDYVICSEVIEHIKDDELFLINIYKHLKQDGLLILSTPLISAPLYRWGLLKKFEKNVGHLRRYSKESLSELVINSGFKIIKIKKTEGVLRNLLYTNQYFGSCVRYIRWPISIFVNFVDDLMIYIFGASNIYVVLKREK